MNLTTKEIYNIAIFAGLDCPMPSECGLDDDTEYEVTNGDIHEGDSVVYTGLRACSADYPEECYVGLTDENYKD